MKYLIAALYLFVAAVFSVYFVEYRVEPTISSPEVPDLIISPSDRIIFLGERTIEPPPQSTIARFGGKIMGEAGLFSKNGYPIWLAGGFGILVPILLIAKAIVLLLKRKS